MQADILIVEDSPTQALRLQLSLQERGLTVMTAAGGAEALRLLAEHRPRLVVSGVALPQMDGYELCRRLKADPALSAIPVVLWTQGVAPEVLDAGRKAGARAIVRKPLGNDVSCETVLRLLAGSTEPETAAAGGYVLVVEDSPTQAVQLEEVLRVRGYETQAVANGRDALEAIRRRRPALVLSDIRMPVMDGFQLCQAIKQDDRLCGIPVILLTALSTPQDVLSALTAGADFHVPKPYQYDYLVARIAETLARGSDAGPLTPEVEETLTFGGATYQISTSREKALRLLLSTYEVAFQQNRELLQAREELRTLNETLESRVQERTAALAVEIAERQRVEAVLQSAAEQRAIIETAMDGFWEVDVQGRLLVVNETYCRMSGYSQSELLGMPIADLDASEATAGLYSHTQTILTQGEARFESQHRRKDGTRFDVEVSVLHRPTYSGLLVAFVRDITAQKRAERDVRQALDDLAHTNAQLETAIARANQMALEAQAANVAKSQFLANMSHEIRTPMNGVIGMTELLRSTDLSDEQRRYAETVSSSADALLSVINDILDFSKIEADKLELETLDFDLRTMLEDAAELLAVRAQEKRLEFICRIAPEVPTFLRGDPGRLRQILVNLGGNAIKFTARGEVQVEVRLESESAERISARFAVRDTGIGIPPDKIGLLFNAFQQVDASTTRRYGGTGLGLAICKRLAELMGGAIGVDSIPGQGSTFWFTVSLAKQPALQRAEWPVSADLRGAHILAVDDNATNRQVLAEQLASWGMRFALADSAAQALGLLRAARTANDPFRLVLTDMQMPECDGETLGKTIKADAALRDTILVMMTSLGMRGDAKRLEGVGFAAYLTKPVKQSQLHDCLATVLGAATAPRKRAPESALVTRHTLSEAARRNVRILLAEDNPTNQQVALRILEKMGYRADAVANGQEAVQALEATPYDLIFMDVQMPVMDGFEATRMIRNAEATGSATRAGGGALPSASQGRRIPIIAMTAHAMKGDRERCLEAGMDDYVSKPIAPQALADAIQKWLPPAREPLPGGIVAPAAPGLPVFDRAALLERLLGDEDLLKDVLACFRCDLPIQMQSLRAHLGAGQAELALAQVHTIKGAAANVGALAFSAVAAAMETAGRAGRLESLGSLMPELEREFTLLQQRLAP